jgi:hypothetical protein
VHSTRINQGAGLLALALLAAPALTGCTSNSSTSRNAASTTTSAPTAASGPSTGTTSAAASATATPTGVATLALGAYTSMWSDYIQASNAGEFPDLALAHYADASAFTTLTKGLQTNHSAGIITKGRPAFDPKVTGLYPSTNPNQVLITDCFDDSNWLTYYKAGGATANTGPGGLHKVDAVVADVHGLWLVDQLAVHGAGTCTR